MEKPLSQYLDHTTLKPNIKLIDIYKVCKEAHVNNFYSVCIPPGFVKDALLFRTEDNFSYKIATVIAFPHGNATAQDKASQIEHAVENGADELDVVVNISNILSGARARIFEEVVSVRNATDKPIKYILEFGYLTPAEILWATEMLVQNKIDFVKTSTGFGPRGVTEEDVLLIKKEFGDKIKFKASGGVRDFDFASKLISLGVDRIGTSNSVEIVNKGKSTSLEY